LGVESNEGSRSFDDDDDERTAGGHVLTSVAHGPMMMMIEVQGASYKRSGREQRTPRNLFFFCSFDFNIFSYFGSELVELIKFCTLIGSF
jgi:hypothetical protein